MRKIAFLLTVAIITMSGSSLFAQKFSIGVKAGLSIPNLTGGSSENPLNTGYKSRTGPDFAMFGEYHLSKMISLSLGLEYSSQGGQKDGFQAFVPTGQLVPLAQMFHIDYFYADFKSVAKMNYLMFPILAKFSWSLSESYPVKFYAAFGPFVGFLLNAHQVTSGSSIIYTDAAHTMPLPSPEQSFDATTDIKDELHAANFGINGYVGFAYNISTQHSIFIEGGGNYGFTPIQKSAENGKNVTGAGVVNLGYAYSF